MTIDLLTHWGRVTHICVSKLTIIGSDNGLSPGRRQAIIWTSDGISLIAPLGKNLSGILIKIHTSSLKKSILKCRLGNAVILSRPQCVNEQKKWCLILYSKIAILLCNYNKKNNFHDARHILWRSNSVLHYANGIGLLKGQYDKQSDWCWQFRWPWRSFTPWLLG